LILKKRHFALVEGFDSQTKVVILCNLAVEHQVPPSISSALAPMILTANSLLFREAGCPLKRSVFWLNHGSGVAEFSISRLLGKLCGTTEKRELRVENWNALLLPEKIKADLLLQ
jgi:hypothetical protein